MSVLGLNCITWDLWSSLKHVGPGPRIEPWTPALGVWSPSHWTTRETLIFLINSLNDCFLVAIVSFVKMRIELFYVTPNVLIFMSLFLVKSVTDDKILQYKYDSSQNKNYILWLYSFFFWMGFLDSWVVTQLVKNQPAMWETWVWSLGWEDPLEKGKAAHSSILWPGEFHGLYSPWGRKESDTSEWLSLFWSIFLFIFNFFGFCIVSLHLSATVGHMILHIRFSS